jgi:hypothetical protein
MSDFRTVDGWAWFPAFAGTTMRLKRRSTALDPALPLRPATDPPESRR